MRQEQDKTTTTTTTTTTPAKPATKPVSSKPLSKTVGGDVVHVKEATTPTKDYQSTKGLGALAKARGRKKKKIERKNQRKNQRENRRH